MQGFQKKCQTCSRVFESESDFLAKTTQWRLSDDESLWFNCQCGSTLMLPEGKYPWYSPEAHLSEAARSLFNTIKTEHKLPLIPSATMKLLALLDDMDSETAEIAQALREDPLLAAKFFHFVHHYSRIPGVGEPIKSLNQAIAMIGRKLLKEFIISCRIQSFAPKTTVFNSEKFWQESILTAAITDHLCQILGVSERQDELYLAASLLNVGKMVGAIFFPEKTDQLCTHFYSEASSSHWSQAEARFDLPSHEILGEIGCVFWGVDSFISDMVRNHHLEEGQNLEDGQAVLVMANCLKHWIQLMPHRILQTDLQSASRELGLSSDDQVYQLVQVVKEKIPNLI